MKLSASQMVKVRRVLRESSPAPRGAIDKLNEMHVANGLVLPAEGCKRVDHRGEAVKAISARKQQVLAHLRGGK